MSAPYTELDVARYTNLVDDAGCKWVGTSPVRELLAALAAEDRLVTADMLIWDADSGQWWKADGLGYTGDFEHAGRFTPVQVRAHLARAQWWINDTHPRLVAVQDPGIEQALERDDIYARVKRLLHARIKRAIHDMAEVHAIERMLELSAGDADDA